MTQTPATTRTGVFIAGACGDIATTLMVGALAIRHRFKKPVAMVSELEPFEDLGLVALDDLRFGGLEVRTARLRDRAMAVANSSRTFSTQFIDAVGPTLDLIDADINIDPDFDWNSSTPAYSTQTLADIVTKMRAAIQTFRRRQDLDRVIFLDLASAEVGAAPVMAHEELVAFVSALDRDDRRAISPSMLRAYAAFLENCAYINFTPNSGADIPALRKLATKQGLPFCGSDAKTGETLIKSVLAPMFLYRNLEVLSWEGVNMLGNNDGKALSDPGRAKSKLGNKKEIISRLLGYPVHSGVDINYVPSMGDWKTAWDLIHFKGFLDVPMTMQFTWQGCDSILAAPLALDLVRFADLALRNGESGPMKHVASFFKDPIGVEELGFVPQYEMLLSYAKAHCDEASSTGKQEIV